MQWQNLLLQVEKFGTNEISVCQQYNQVNLILVLVCQTDQESKTAAVTTTVRTLRLTRLG